MPLSLNDWHQINDRIERQTAGTRSNRVLLIGALAIAGLIAIAILRATDMMSDPIIAAPSVAPPASPVINVHIVQPTHTPRPAATRDPTPAPCHADMLEGEPCVWTGSVPPTPTPIIPECRDGAATPGAICTLIPVVPTPTPLPTCTSSHGSGRCIWQPSPVPEGG